MIRIAYSYYVRGTLFVCFKVVYSYKVSSAVILAQWKNTGGGYKIIIAYFQNSSKLTY